MRKLAYLIALTVYVSTVMGQTTSTVASYATLKSNLAKWQKTVTEPKKEDFSNDKKFTKAKAKYDKKVANANTWFSLGKAYKDIFVYAGDNLSYNLPQNQVMLIKGTPKEKKVQENKEIWEYEAFRLYFTDGKVSKWENKEKRPEAKEAIKAFKKATELDTKGSVKKKAIEQLIELRNFLKNEGVAFYFAKDYKTAIADYKCSSKIYELEAMAGSDTTNYNISEVYYYGAAFSDANKNIDQAIEFYQSNVDYCAKAPKAQQYEPVRSYRFLANDYKVKGDLEKTGEVLLAAFKAFPEEKDILVDLTQYYLDAKQPKKALEFLDKALDKDPQNFLFVFVKGTLYDGFKAQVYKKMDDISAEIYKADTLRQEGKLSRTKFRDLKAEKLKASNALWPEADTQMDKAIAEYNNALKIKPDYSNASFNLGAVYYNKGAQITRLASFIPANDMKAYDAEMAKAKDFFLKAKPFLEEALKNDPYNVAVLQTLKTVYAKMGKYDKVKELKAKIEEAEAKKANNIGQ